MTRKTVDAAALRSSQFGAAACYDMVLADGSTAGTKLSFGLAETEPVPMSLWPRTWRRQLRLRAEAEFWQGLEGGVVEYDIPPSPEPRQPLPE